jgi:hypothetical protein
LWPRPTWPPPHPQSPPRCAPVPPRRASPLSWAAWWRTLPRPPQALSLLPPPRPWARGAQAPNSRGELAPHRPPPPRRPTTSILKSPGRRAPAACAAKTPHSSVPGALTAGLRAARSCSRRCAARVRAQARGVGGSDRATSTVTSCWRWVKAQITPAPHGQVVEEWTEGLLTRGP